MSDSLIPTLRQSSPQVVRVLDEARARLGLREVGGQNHGPIVEEVCRPFLSAHRFAEQYAAGHLEWCAAFACYCWWKVWPEIRPLVSLTASTLYEHLGTRGWTFRPGEKDPEAGDFAFFQHTDARLGQIRHVGLVERYEAAAGTLHTLEGNARGNDESTGAVRARTYHLTDRCVYGFGRLVLPGAEGAP